MSGIREAVEYAVVTLTRGGAGAPAPGADELREKREKRKAEKRKARARKRAEESARSNARANAKRKKRDERRRREAEERERSELAEIEAEIERMEAEERAAAEEAAPEEGKVGCQSGSGDYLGFEVGRLRRENDRLKSRVALLESDAGFASRMRIPRTALDSLELAGDAFSSRLVIMDEARKSAAEYDGDVAEVWDVLQAMACVLHPLVFSGHEGMIDREFQSRTGFECALREVKQANKDAGRAKARTVEYGGRRRDATPHVKGRCPKKGRSLRVHFFADHDEDVLVVAFCGEHRASFMTPRL